MYGPTETHRDRRHVITERRNPSIELDPRLAAEAHPLMHVTGGQWCRGATAFDRLFGPCPLAV
jgi:hypothetical protein